MPTATAPAVDRQASVSRHGRPTPRGRSRFRGQRTRRCGRERRGRTPRAMRVPRGRAAASSARHGCRAEAPRGGGRGGAASHRLRAASTTRGDVRRRRRRRAQSRVLRRADPPARRAWRASIGAHARSRHALPRVAAPAGMRRQRGAPSGARCHRDCRRTREVPYGERGALGTVLTRRSRFLCARAAPACSWRRRGRASDSDPGPGFGRVRAITSESRAHLRIRDRGLDAAEPALGTPDAGRRPRVRSRRRGGRPHPGGGPS